MDLWNGNSWVNGGGGNPVLYTIYNGWSDTPANYYWIRSNLHAAGYFIMNDPYVIASDAQCVRMALQYHYHMNS